MNTIFEQMLSKYQIVTDKDRRNAILTERSLNIKIEIDTQPPLKFQTEQKLLLHPFSFMTRCFIISDLYAGKMHALVFRTWKNCVKGRDWYDFE